MSFWKNKSMESLNEAEWESLCDQCGQCCLIQLEDEKGHCQTTNVVCEYYDQSRAGCSVYHNRQAYVPNCLVLSKDTLDEAWFAPPTCAYRLLAENKPLFDWHPLIAGDRKKMIEQGIAISGKVVSEAAIHPDELDLHIIGTGGNDSC